MIPPGYKLMRAGRHPTAWCAGLRSLLAQFNSERRWQLFATRGRAKLASLSMLTVYDVVAF